MAFEKYKFSAMKPAHRAIAGLLQMGFTSKKLMARALGMNGDKFNQELVHMLHIRDSLIHGLPSGVTGDLHSPVRCPRCAERIAVVPCVHCTSSGGFPTKNRDACPSLEGPEHSDIDRRRSDVEREVLVVLNSRKVVTVAGVARRAERVLGYPVGRYVVAEALDALEQRGYRLEFDDKVIRFGMRVKEGADAIAKPQEAA